MARYFSEYLPRLKTTSVQVELPRDQVDSVEVRDDSVVINSSIDIKLPSAIQSSQASHAVNAVSPGLTSIRIRDRQAAFLANGSMESFLQDQYQWNISNIQKYHMHDVLRCVSCDSPIIDLKEVKKLLPMPSELWYEMLDFWHCHKPTVENNNIGLLKKFNQLKPNPKTLIIGSYYFIANPEDWANIEACGQENESLECGCCHEILGELDSNIGNYKILKWQLKVENELFKPFAYISLKLVEEMNYSALRVFQIIDEKSKRSIQVWCFGLGIDINVDTLGVMKNCLKILYKENMQEDSTSRLKGGNNNSEILVEYEKSFDDFCTWLQKVNQALPENLQKYNDWNVTYIPI